MPDEPTPEVAALPMREWVRRKSLEAMKIYENEHLETNGHNIIFVLIIGRFLWWAMVLCL
jgi:hypothetical protein